MKRKLRMGMVGGGQGAFIGTVHRMAARLDGEIELVCGAFSSDPKNARSSGRELHIDPDRTYSNYVEMFRRERKLPADERMDFVSIVTPNHLHFPVAKRALESGFPVVCDKPMTRTLAEARALQHIVKKSGLHFALTHNYTGYPLVKEARAAVKAGRLGKIRKVVVEYPQGWLSTALEKSGQKQAAWRTDPRKAGASCCMGDIGTHAENLAEYVTGLQIESLCADLGTFVRGRHLDDDGAVLLRFKGGARGVLFASQIATGEENGLAIRVYGEKGGLEWRQMEPNTLIMKWADRPAEILRAGQGYLSAPARDNTRLPPGHPEGFIEGFANIYRSIARALHSRRKNGHDFPTVDDGLRGMAFIDAVVKSSRSRDKWVKFPAH